MRLTIIKNDNTVVIDGFAVTIDCGSLSNGIHAVQWDQNRGWIEFSSDGFSPKAVNEEIDDVSRFQSLIDDALLEIERIKSEVREPLMESVPSTTVS